jgi:protein phosphatase 1 regulatory subunit 32
MAKPSPLPIGRANPHVQQSHGAENYIMNFYCTNYSTSFTKPNIENNKGRKDDIPAYSGNEVFKPRSAPLYHQSGFTSNVRPQIYYNRTLDNHDNPEMG